MAVSVQPGPEAQGSVPPQNTEAETSVLGAILLTEQALDGVLLEVGLKPDDFYRPRHQLIFTSMIRLKEKAEPEAVDALTVCDDLRRSGDLEQAGGEAYIHSLPTVVPAVGNVLHYARIVKEHALLRSLLVATRDIQDQVSGHSGDPRELIERAEAALFRIGHDDGRGDMRSLEAVLHEEVDKLEELSRGDVGLTGTPSGFSDLDELTGGFQPGNLIVLAARPSMGKCLPGSALVYDPKTGARRSMLDVVESVELGEEAFVASLGRDLRLRSSHVSAAIRNGRKPIYRLTTKLGRTVEATANHPLFTIGGWRSLESLSVGDRIAVPRRLPRLNGADSMPDHEIVLMAALIADGNVTGHSPRFSYGKGSAVLPEVESAAAAMGLRLTDTGSHGTATISAGRGKPNPLRALLERHGLWGRGSATKFVPRAIFGLSDEQVARFLNILYGCDGHVHSARLRQVGYTTISKRLAEDVQHLLLRLGIVGCIRRLRRPVHEGTETVAREVRITDQAGLARFCTAIGACGKQRQVAHMLEALNGVRFKTNVDTIPTEVWGGITYAMGGRPMRDLSVAAGRPANHNWHVGTRGLSRALLGEIAVALHEPSLMHLADSDVWWDEVARIEPAGETETFDLTVPDDHSFVANDIVVHNSTLATNVAENAAIDHGKPVALFSLEMSETELAHRFIASQAKISSDELRKGRVKADRWPKVLKAVEKLARAPIFVDDSSDIGILEMRAKARRMHARHELGLVVVDYLQLMRPDGRADSRVEQIGQISRGLKILARELEIPVIAVSQLSRAVESRNPPIPMLSDLRECVTGDTLVNLANGRRVPIADLVDTTPIVLAVDGDNRVISAQSDKVWRVGRRPVFRMRLASGRTLRGTADHRVRTGGGWQRLGELVRGDRVALARSLPEPRRPIRWPDDRVLLLGHLIGDGSYLSHQPLRYTTACEESSEAVRLAAMREFGARVTRHEGGRAWHQLVIAGNGNRWHPAGVGAWLRELGIWNQRSADKRVPAEAFRLADDQIAKLVRHLWATDGTVWCGQRPNGRRDSRVAFSTASGGLAADVAALLLRLGIVARVGTTKQPSGNPLFNVVVSGVDAQLRFLEVVGSFGERRAQAAALREALADVVGAPNVDTLPVQIWDEVRGAMTAQGVTQRAMAAMRGTAYGGSSHFKFAPSRAVIESYSTALGVETLARHARDDLFWDRVVGVEPDGEEDVFDLTVPGPACWLADGVVTHNSGQIEQDADVVMFVYRDEYYNRESERLGEADVIMAKHRNGPIGEITLTFLPKYPRFANLYRERAAEPQLPQNGGG